MSVTLDDLIQELVAYNAVPSTFGTILDRAEASIYVDSNYRMTQEGEDEEGQKIHCKTEVVDIWAQLSNMHDMTLSKAPVYRLIKDITAVSQFTPKSEYPKLNKFQKKLYNQYDQGAMAIAVLRIYHVWASTSTERALANVYAWMNLAHNKRGAIELHQSFAQGTAKKSRDQAIDLYSDCLVAVGDYIKRWNAIETQLRNSKKSKKSKL